VRYYTVRSWTADRFACGLRLAGQQQPTDPHTDDNSRIRLSLPHKITINSSPVARVGIARGLTPPSKFFDPSSLFSLAANSWGWGSVYTPQLDWIQQSTIYCPIHKLQLISLSISKGGGFYTVDPDYTASVTTRYLALGMHTWCSDSGLCRESCNVLSKKIMLLLCLTTLRWLRACYNWRRGEGG